MSYAVTFIEGTVVQVSHLLYTTTIIICIVSGIFITYHKKKYKLPLCIKRLLIKHLEQKGANSLKKQMDY